MINIKELSSWLYNKIQDMISKEIENPKFAYFVKFIKTLSRIM